MRASVYAVVFVAVALPTQAESRPLSICEVLDRHTHSGDSVNVRALVVGSREHGVLLTDTLDSDPCPGWPRRFLIAPHYMGLAICPESCAPTTDEEKSAFQLILGLMKLAAQRQFQPFFVSVLGTLVRKSLILIFRYPRPPWGNGEAYYSGYGFGVDGAIPAMIIPKSIREDSQ